MKRKICLLIAVGVILLQLSADPFAIWASENNGNNVNAAETETTKYKLILSTPKRDHLMGEYEAGEVIKSAPANPVIEGHKFWGWFEEPNGYGIRWYFQENKMPDHDVTLYANFTIESYNATLNNEGKTSMQTVVYQNKINEPTKPVKDGYTFIGWYDAETGGKKWDFANDLMPGKNITLYARFASKTYPMTYDNDGVTTTETVDYDGLAEEPTTPTKAGYTFDGWYDAETGGKKWDFAQDKMPANPVTLYARFTMNNYTATFNNDGTTTTQTADYQEALTEPTEPTKDGYTFEGWYDAQTGGNKWNFATNKMPGNNITLYARYSAKSYTTTFDKEGTTTTQTANYDSLLTEPTAPTKTGYTFDGWYDAETGGNKWNFATDKMPAKNITLYARFTVKSYTATFDKDGTTTTQTANYDSLLTEPTAPTKEGYTFDGWYDAETGGNKWNFATNKMPAKNVTLYARFTVKSYTATFDKDGTKTTQTVNYDSLLTEPTAPTKDGYIFTGWYDAETGGNKWDFAAKKMPAKNVTLYARFSANAYTATFDKDGTTTTQAVDYDSLITEPTAPTKDGYTFDGWYDAETGGNKWDFAAKKMPAKNVTLYARFSTNAYTATFDKDGTTTTQAVDYDSLITEPAAPTKDGYTFDGWYDAETGGNKWNFAAKKMPANNMTLYARFSLKSYTATFDVEDTTTTQAVDYDSLLIEPTAPTKDGHTFDGWYDAETGGSKWDFAANKMPAKDVTLYARFTVKSYTATLNGEEVTTQTVDYQGLLQEPLAPTKDGYTFDGWYDAETGGNKWDFATNKMPANDLALYARFTQIPVVPVDPVNPVNPVNPIQPADPAHQDDLMDDILPATENTNITAAIKPANDPVKKTTPSKELPRTGDQENILYLLIGLLLIAGTFGFFKKMSHK
ncbi:TPA: InlB B-repeat-containing protein [Listeria innocua]|uniref:InlB B-repeat-containing protein n=1 Tax=Listeria innocua TaxID=1642 RepID=UPI0012C0412E|nr:InlB B-repeat-containing protein [Listeria innocua]QPQ97640.1 InlB B-repeat-containing protein [Listeria welshimeri]ECL7894802.1 InlB B-repeat-containing protein [Listeria innocua]ECX4531442.1 InlB B-repeat-containing protein [Listeria innocua]ECX5126109.1 InlB B-repeat-containing protein [Listeria innocua]EHF3640666.1 InlB B-repeat-containing protein [Listeria innocua]